MRLDFNGRFTVNVSIDKTFAFLTNPESVSRCISDLEGFVPKDKSSFEAKIRVGVGPIHGVLNTQCSISDTRPPNSATLTIDGSGFGNKIRMEIKFTLASKSEQLTEVTWISTTEMKGIMTGLGEGMIRKLSQEKMEEVIERVKNGAA
jgi:carbon monoxide dehydrogenase subunit G